MNKSDIAIIGAGTVGQALTKTFAANGKTVMLGVPDPDKYRELTATLGNVVAIGSVNDAIGASGIVILAVPYAAAETIVKSIADWRNKILVDATNPIAAGLSGLTLGTTTSGAEETAKFANGARMVKAFNTTGAENMADSRYFEGKVFMPVCGNDADAKSKVMALATLIGFDAVDMGDLTSARYLEPFGMVWIHLAMKMGHGRNFAFGQLRR